MISYCSSRQSSVSRQHVRTPYKQSLAYCTLMIAADVVLPLISHLPSPNPHLPVRARRQMRREVLGPHAEPMLVIGPKMLRRPLLGYASTEPLLFRFLDSAHTMVGSPLSQSDGSA